jgi:hypothetical protein
VITYKLRAIDNYRSKILPQYDFCLSTEARFTLDYEENYWLLQSICRMLGNDARREEADRLLENNPEFKDIN